MPADAGIDNNRGARVVITAVMEGGSTTLHAIAALGVGSILELPPGAQDAVTISSKGAAVFRGRLVQAQGSYAVHVDVTCGTS